MRVPKPRRHGSARPRLPGRAGASRQPASGGPNASVVWKPQDDAIVHRPASRRNAEDHVVRADLDETAVREDIAELQDVADAVWRLEQGTRRGTTHDAFEPGRGNR